MYLKLRRSYGLYVWAVLLLWLGVTTRADVIYLKNGKIVQTKRAWVDGDSVKYQMPDGIKTLPRTWVEDVVSESTTPTPKFVRVPVETTSPPEQPPVPPKAKDKPALIKSPVRDAHKEISGDTIAQLKKNLAEDPTSGPRRAELVTALNLRAGFLLLRGELEEALKTCQEALAHNPSDGPTLTNLSVIQFEKGAYRDAEETLRRVETLGGGRNQTVNYLLGEAYYAQDKIQPAIAAWRQALQIEPDPAIQARLEQALQELKTHENLEKQATRHFILRYDKQVADARLGDEILDYLETAYRELSRTLLDTPPETITVILYPNQTYFDVTRAPGWSSAMYDGKIRVPIKGVNRLSDATRATLKHELAHAFIALAVSDRCPAWFNEGIAQQIEGRRSQQYHKLLTEARRKNKLLPLEQISRSFATLPPSDAELAYAQALSAIEYVERKGGTTAVRAILERLRARRRFGEALGEVIWLGPVDFEKAWVSSLAEISSSSW